ncbi:MAG: PepSY-like domain-containing protein [Tannerellaceae bacterium]|nr:PepSY-like domain-containing protein [Tannerellaceae bacterium]
MKRRLHTYIFTSLLILFTSACTSGDDPANNGNGPTPGAQVIDGLEQIYPGVSAVTWSEKKNYYVADFDYEGQSLRVWLTREGRWMVKKTEVLYSDMDDRIKETFLRTAYGTWEVRTAYLLERSGLETVGEISVSRGGKVSNLYFTMQGDYIRVADDFKEYSDVPVTVPSQLQNALDDMFDNAHIVDISVIHVIDSEIAVGLMDREHFMTSVFQSDYEWIVNFCDLRLEELPAAVLTGYRNSQYYNYDLLHCREMRTKSGISYLFYVDRGGKVAIAEFSAGGKLSSELSRSHAMTKYLLIR